MGGLQGFDNTITAVVVNTNTDTVYVGGDFKIGGSTLFNNVAKWDHGQWSTLRSGFGLDGGVVVKTLALDSSGNLYVGGNGLAKWDGMQWSKLGTNLAYGDGGVNSIAFDAAGNLYAGGTFIIAGSVGATNIAKWNGSSWVALGSGISGTNSLTAVNCLTFDQDGNLIIGGRFNNAGGVPANNVARWNGTNWSALGVGIGGSYARVMTCVFDSSGNLYVGGDFVSAGGLPTKSLAKWDGTNWVVSGLGLGTTACGSSPAVYSLATDSANSVFVSGTFGSAGGVWATNVARWDGTNWFAMGTGVGGNWCGARVYPLVLDVEGNLLAAWGNYLGRWDGNSWSAFQLPQPEPPGSGVSGEVTALLTDASSNLYVGGTFNEAGGVVVTNVAKWNGVTWSPLSSGLSGPYYLNIYALALDSAGNLYAGGNFTTSGGIATPGIARWNGNTWSAVGIGTNGINGEVRALVFDSVGNLYAGGWFTVGSNSSRTGISKWDGNSWSQVGSGINGLVTALAIDKFGNLYAGGTFSVAGSVYATNIAKWNGTVWSSLGTGIVWSRFADQAVSALVVDKDANLYVGGSFTNAGGVATPNIAKWDGSAWSALGRGSGVV